VAIEGGGSKTIDWTRAYTLAALQLVVTLGWMAYGHFMPSLLERFGLSALSGLLSVYLVLAGATFAPLIGSVGDRIASRGGKRFPLVVTGGLFAGITFLTVAFMIAAPPEGLVRWLFLAGIMIWIAAMVVLQTPALSLLPSVASAERWPSVVSPLVVATVLPTALWPLLRRALDAFGGPAVYIGGGLLVFVATYLLRNAFAEPAPGAMRMATPTERAPGGGLGAAPSVVFAIGIVSAFITRLAYDVVPTILTARLGSGDAAPALLSAATLGSTTLLAPPLGGLSGRLGSRRGALGSVALAVACAAIAPFAASVVVAGAIAIVLGAALALHLDCALPFSLQSLPPERAGLSAGLYLGGIFAGSQLAPLAAWLGMWG